MATIVQLSAGTTLPHPGSAQARALAKYEHTQAKGTPLDLQLTCRSVTVAGHGLVAGHQVAGALAALINRARSLTQHFPQIAHIPTWPGKPLAEAEGATVHIRWVTDAPWVGPVLAVLGGLTAAIGLGVFADVGLLTAAVIGAFVALGIYLLVDHWQFVKAVVTHPIASVDSFLAFGLIAFGAVLVVQQF